MSRQILLLLLVTVVNVSDAVCRGSLLEPNVTVGDSQHLLVNWEPAFEDCDSIEVQSATVQIDSATEEVAFAEKEAKIEANPCLTHPFILVKLELEEKTLWSYVSRYNDYNENPKIEELYSGLLQKQVVDKICLDINGTLFVPEIPDELSECVVMYEKQRKYSEASNWSTQLVFTIVDPQNESRRKVVKTGFKIDEECRPTRKNDLQDDEDLDQGQTITIIIICSIVGTILIVVLVSATIWRCLKRFRDKKVTKIDINPNYEEAGMDYEYRTTSEDYDYDTMENEASIRRKEVEKMEKGDQNSVYGKTEEGWEEAVTVAVDTNSVYQK